CASSRSAARCWRCCKAMCKRRAFTGLLRWESGAGGLGRRAKRMKMPGAPGNLDLHLYLADFPPQGQPLNDGTVKAVDGLAGPIARGGSRVTILCESASSSRRQSPNGYEIV